METSSLSSNWKKLKASLARQDPTRKHADAITRPHDGLKRKRPSRPTHYQNTTAQPRPVQPSSPRKRMRISGRMSTIEGTSGGPDVVDPTSFVKKDIVKDRVDRINGGLHADVDLGRFVALDCEMVGVGPPPHLESALARVSIVNYNGDCVYDSYVKPMEPVTDYRTHVSGIEERHLLRGRTFKEVQQDVADIIKDRTVVGHSLRGDWNALMLSHPLKNVRDTAKHAPYRKLAGGGSPKLKILASGLLGLEIQIGEHSSIEDARATMLLYRRDKDLFERDHAKKWPSRATAPTAQDGEAESSQKKPKNKNGKKKKKKK